MEQGQEIQETGLKKALRKQYQQMYAALLSTFCLCKLRLEWPSPNIDFIGLFLSSCLGALLT